MKKIHFFVCCMFLWSCITEYNATITEKTDDILVVEGIITNDTTFIVLSKTVPLDVYAGESVYVNDANLYVECDNGTQSPASQYIGSGKYRIYTGSLHTDQKYRLRILTDKNEYQSEFLSPLLTPKIDSISWIKEGEEQQVHICVSTHDPQNQSPYYLWSYKEDWEFTAQYYATAYYVDGPVIRMYDPKTQDLNWCELRMPGPIVEYTPENPNYGYYCWNSNQSKTLLLGSTEKLTENRISEKKLVSKDPDDRRWMELYRIRIRQNMIRREAYDYYSNLQKNIERTGSIFSPIPAEMKGNITCITNTNLRVVGYTEVSVTTEKTRFIDKSDKLYEPNQCPTPFDCMLMQILKGRADGSELVLAPLECVDCRVFGTKIKPDNWPNDHQ